MPPYSSGNGQPEHAELGHVRHDLERDVAVGQVPFVRMRRDLAVGEFAHLVADRLERLVEPAVADGRAVLLAHQRDEPRAVLRGVAGRDQLLDRGRHARRDLRRAQARDRPAARSRPGSSECRRASAREIRRARCAPAAPRSRAGAAPRSCAPHRRQAGGSPPHRWRTRRARARRAARGRAAWREMRPPSVTLAPTARVASASSASTAAVASRALAIRSDVSGRVAASGIAVSRIYALQHDLSAAHKSPPLPAAPPAASRGEQPPAGGSPTHFHHLNHYRANFREILSVY